MDPSKGTDAPQQWWTLRELSWLTAASLLAVSLGYLARPTMVVSPGSGLLSALSVRDFHGAEGTYRWTRDRSALIFPDPGPGLEVRIEAEVSGFRPRGESLPLLVVQAGGASLRTQLARGMETIVVEAVTEGWWKSDLEVRFLSETFTPGESDRRALGVRVHAVRLRPLGSGLWPPGLPPARQLVTTTFGLLLLFGLLIRAGRPRRHAFYVGLLVALAWAFAFAFARPYAALSSPTMFWTLALATAAHIVFPNATRVFVDSISEAVRAARRGARLARGKRAVGLVILGGIGVTASYLARPMLQINIGSGEEVLIASQFAGFDQIEGVKFRRALPGAAMDLRDFGGGSDWTIAITAQVVGPSRSLELARAGEEGLAATLGPSWSRHTMIAHAPWGWRSGLELLFPSASYSLDLRVAQVQIDRGRSLPSLRAAMLVAGAVLLFFAACGATGLSAPACFALAASLLVAQLVALTAAPVSVIPFLPFFLGTTAAGLAFAALATGALRALAKREWIPALAPAAIAASAVGFMAWLTATLFPLYQGGHFVFHSSIAEEIWQGRFLTFYLPSPDNMLSVQKQWGNLVIPHSCLYHTLVSPLAMLPRGWFYALEKAVLASMLATLSLAAAILASRMAGARAGALTAIVAVTSFPTFQLLELGHLMTIFGCWAATMALTFLVLRLEQLPERATWWGATALLTLCFLSYTASLLFAATVVALAVPILYRAVPQQAKALALALAAASAAAFFLYYVHWTVPFVEESLPQILASAGSKAEGPTLWSRIAGEPRKLAYTYGAAALPLAGLAGLGLLTRSRERTLLILWAGALILFSGIDLFFNLLLKHHYFVIAPVSVGLGVLGAWLASKRLAGGVLALLFLVSWIINGGSAAVRLALGPY
ncbi:MAG: hypothetical protein ACRD1X_01700 [Vicinamibacteria bacterium]